MKRSRLILGVVSIMTLCLTACGKPNMSFEDAVDNIAHSQLQEMMADADYYQESFNISTNFSIPDDDVKAKVSFSTDSKQNTKDSQWETNLSLDLSVSEDWDKVKIKWDAMLKQIANVIYFKLNSLDISSSDDDFIDEDAINDIKWQRYSIEITDEMINEIYEDTMDDFDLESFEKLYDEEKVDKLVDGLKKSLINKWALVYSGIYSQFDWYNAYQFSIDRDTAFMAFIDYLKWIIPDYMMDDLMEEIEEEGLDEIFEDFPLTNFRWYLVITWKNRVQIVIENIDIEDEDGKMYGTFGRDGYEFVAIDDDEEVFKLSAMLNESHYDISMIVDDEKVLECTITPSKSRSKIGLDFDIDIDFDDYGDKIHIPLEGWWTWEKVSKFSVEAPEDSKDLTKDIMWDDYKKWNKNQAFKNNAASIITTPIIAGWIMVAALAPRMNSAQGRARDVARKNDLSQIQVGIITSQQDKWIWPGINDWADKGMAVSDIEKELLYAGMSSVPSDPLTYSFNYWLWENYKDNSAMWEYLYLVTKRNWVKNWWFVLMAKTEVEWASNWVVCDSAWKITNETDIWSKDFQLCNTMIKDETKSGCSINNGTCTYSKDDQLRYIVTY